MDVPTKEVLTKQQAAESPAKRPLKERKAEIEAYLKTAKLRAVKRRNFSVRTNRLADFPGWVYVIRIAGTDLVKVGISKDDPVRRINTIEWSMPFEIERLLLLHCKNAPGMERKIHVFFAEKCVGNEWFFLTAGDLEYLGRTFQPFEAAINSRLFEAHRRMVEAG